MSAALTKAVGALIKAKGRFHTEQNYLAVVEAYDATRQAAVVIKQAASLAGPRVYISGPMTGIADLNAPAFAAEAARLLALGYQVENPADVVLSDGATWADFMRADIPRLLACTHIRMLDGWTMSKGARLEHHIAISLGLEVLTDDDLQEAK